MKSIKKFIIGLLIAIFIVLTPLKVNAASGHYTINSNSSVTNGSNISVTFKINAANLFYWQAYITYDSSKLQLVSGSTSFQGESDNINGVGSTSRTLTFKAKNTGNAYVAIAMGDKNNNINSSSEEISFTKVTKTITINKYIPKVYSTNNNLKSLSIEGYNINPEFKKDILEYSIELPAKTEKIKINAEKEDNSANISGNGEIKVKEGENKIVVTVTAENGNEKKYIINAKVKELNPIYVNIGKEQYTVIRKKEELPKPNNIYEESTTMINNEEIPVYKSNITNYTLIGLTDIDGITNLYIYNKQKNNYTKYYELSSNNLVISPLDEKIDLSNKYKKSIQSINGIPITVYKENINSNYSIFKGINIETGKTNIYIYEKTENSIQIFNQEKVKNTPTIFLYTTIGLFIALVFIILFILIAKFKVNKKPKELKLNYKKKEL